MIKGNFVQHKLDKQLLGKVIAVDKKSLTVRVKLYPSQEEVTFLKSELELQGFEDD